MLITDQFHSQEYYGYFTVCQPYLNHLGVLLVLRWQCLQSVRENWPKEYKFKEANSKEREKKERTKNKKEAKSVIGIIITR